MKTAHKTILVLMLACLLLAMGGGIGWWLARHEARPVMEHPAAGQAEVDTKRQSA